ncbi:MAG TPA: NUDIX hydrolase [Actinomycetota bacterium]|nr:NUDIX hydrolase [Actinomycetota bacterium]
MTGEVRAAGGVVLRRADGHAQTVLVHRPRYDDWSFPKGKLHDGESFLDAAIREVREETGLTPRVGAELPASTYQDQHGAPKLVRYWLMEALDGRDPRPTQEVDEAKWVPLDGAGAMLTYDRDREMLDAILARDGTAYVVRHAKAGDRREWPGDDRLRPLSKPGRRQARGLARFFDGRSIDRILSSPAVRCVETVRTLAESRSLAVELHEEFEEGASLEGALHLLDRLASEDAVLCGHGDLIPAAIDHLEGRGAVVIGQRNWKKGSIWILEREAGLVVRARSVPPIHPV